MPTCWPRCTGCGQGLEPVEPRDDLGHAAATTCTCSPAQEPTPQRARAVEQYLISTVDHGFNASTFTARVIASTGADVAACLVGAIGALSGPLHGGAPSRALDTLDAIGTPDRIDPWIRERVLAGDRIMGFGHPVYRTEDPRSRMLRGVAERLRRARGRRLVDLAEQVERRVVEILAELKPGRELHTNVEFYAGVVMELCGLPREMFTPTFAVGPGGRLERQRAGAGRGQQDHPPVGPVRRPAAAPARAALLRTSRRGRAYGAPRVHSSGRRRGPSGRPTLGVGDAPDPGGRPTGR